MAGILAQIGASMIEPLTSLWNGLVASVPGIAAAIIILIFGWLIALLVQFIVGKVLVQVKLDKWALEKTNFSKVIGAFKLSNFFALIAKWYTFILFLPPAAAVIDLAPLADFLSKLALWVPNVIAGVVVGLVGLCAASYVGARVSETKAKWAELVADVSKFLIIVFTAIIVLDQVGISIDLAQQSFLIILGGIMLALGIGFGLGLKDTASGLVKHFMKRL